MKRILALILAILPLAGCAAKPTEAVEPPPRFTYEIAENVPGGSGFIITDTTTGCQYLLVDRGRSGGMVYLEPAAECEPEGHPFAEDAKYIAKAIYGEARGCSKTEQAAVAWCILNRVDSEDPYFPDDIISVVTQEKQFDGYDPNHPVTDEFYELAIDVIDLWLKEDGTGIVAGRVLPPEYLWFLGDGKTNTFRDAYLGDFNTWDWSLVSPYE